MTLIRSRGEYAEQNAGVNTKTAGMRETAGMTTSFQMPLQSTPFLWSDAGSASIGSRQEVRPETQFQTWSISAAANLQNIAAVKAISAPTERKKVLTNGFEIFAQSEFMRNSISLPLPSFKA